MIEKFFLLAIFGIAMAHLEGVVVLYLRKILGITDTKTNTIALDRIPPNLIRIEKTREAATIIMLAALALLTAQTWGDRAAVFLWTFAFWDLFYYVSLYLLTRWPSSVREMDVLFLIPRPWIAPVWVPVGVSSITIILLFLLIVIRV